MELTKGESRGGVPLSDDEAQLRMNALQARAESLGAICRARELKVLEDLKAKALARLEALSKQSAERHEAAMAQGVSHHE
jgi:hypothetical protein